ncbi:hypothetical protein MCC01998_02350 [Bifidobacteriaceae bacterium MCC01998]|nr:hypothetical protein MCC02037_11730 [Bifidobacteriaceae bacterium MCC02037]GDZ68306.1 hypothetical protein MCC01988_11730 [Bifidobacteriaceae bacterium MCC01988]GDZ73160.1 hypothetical protein MCC01998_02350 [Bifidobacteriaceae bacterium MCC01998]
MQKEFNVMTIQNIIVVRKSDIFTVCGIEASVLSFSDATIFLMNDMNTRVQSCITVANLWRLIRSAIIDEDDFQGLV